MTSHDIDLTNDFDITTNKDESISRQNISPERKQNVTSNQIDTS